LLSYLKISGFRAFREFRVDGLARVNLFVGTNNSGKTSILEAAELVAMGGMRGLRRGPRRRGEWARVGEESTPHDRRLDLVHLFHGHTLKVDSSFRISGGSRLWVQCEVVEKEGDPTGEEPNSALQFSSSSEKARSVSPFLRDVEAVQWPFASDSYRPVHFLGTETVLASELGELWYDVVLTPEEEGVLEAIRIVEPDIERIAVLGEGDSSIFVKLRDTEQRLPLGSMGDGLKHLFALALHLFSAKGGYLLVDEIDTGLHHTVMVKMWQLVIETARRLDVQVLATTHSLDCVRALAWVQERNPEIAEEVTLHRVERGLPSTVRYTMDELAIAAEHHLEVR
jgi:AAA15 family ATPase/GTPase